MLKSLSIQLIIAAIAVAALFFFWPGFTTTLVIGVALGMVLVNLSAPVALWVEQQIAKWKARPG